MKTECAIEALRDCLKNPGFPNENQVNVEKKTLQLILKHLEPWDRRTHTPKEEETSIEFDNGFSFEINEREDGSLTTNFKIKKKNRCISVNLYEDDVWKLNRFIFNYLRKKELE